MRRLEIGFQWIGIDPGRFAVLSATNDSDRHVLVDDTMLMCPTLNGLNNVRLAYEYEPPPSGWRALLRHARRFVHWIRRRPVWEIERGSGLVVTAYDVAGMSMIYGPIPAEAFAFPDLNLATVLVAPGERISITIRNYGRKPMVIGAVVSGMAVVKARSISGETPVAWHVNKSTLKS